eukprot:GHVN01001854.1.p1 GENE.GHVN01001854.1~~GHVN01001854.1.p1  ORF type:complete len:1630 (+),score=150.23 GHVN01001854.1:2261-7150(+)
MFPNKLCVLSAYRGQTVLITGVTGFVGKVLFIKLITELHNAGIEDCKIVVLIRWKGTSSPLERFKSLLSIDAFGPLRRSVTATLEGEAKQQFVFSSWCLSRVDVLDGDVTKEGFGLQADVLSKLKDTLTIIMHCAANVKFTDDIVTAINNNIMPCINSFRLASQCPEFVSYCHVSTAYVNSDIHDDPHTGHTQVSRRLLAESRNTAPGTLLSPIHMSGSPRSESTLAFNNEKGSNSPKTPLSSKNGGRQRQDGHAESPASQTTSTGLAKRYSSLRYTPKQTSVAPDGVPCTSRGYLNPDGKTHRKVPLIRERLYPLSRMPDGTVMDLIARLNPSGALQSSQTAPTPTVPTGRFLLDVSSDEYTSRGVTGYYIPNSKLTDYAEFPNTYTYSKRICEHVLFELWESLELPPHPRFKESRKLPLSIVRPSIVGCSYRDPLPGWLDTLMGAGLVYAAVSTGALEWMPMNARCTSDQIPVDYVANAILVSTAVQAKQYKASPLIVHSTSSALNPVTWGFAASVVIEAASQWPPPPNMTVRKPKFKLGGEMPVSQKLREGPLCFALMLGQRVLSKKASKKLRAYSKVIQQALTLAEVTRHFSSNEWVFDTTNLMSIRERITDDSKSRFEVDPLTIHWEEWLRLFMYGLRKWIFMDKVAPPPTWESSCYVDALKVPVGERSLIGHEDGHQAISNGEGGDAAISGDDDCLVSDEEESVLFESDSGPTTTTAGDEGDETELRVEAVESSANLHTGERNRRFESCGQNNAPIPEPVWNAYNRENAMSDVLNDKKVREAVEWEVQKRLDCRPPFNCDSIAASDSSEVVHGAVTRMEVLQETVEMVSTIAAEGVKRGVVGAIHCVLRRVWPWVFSRLMIDRDALHQLKLVVNSASRLNRPVVICPSHHSYLDFLLISHIFYENGLTMPMIVAGDEFSKIHFVNRLFRNCGAFMMRRSFKQVLAPTTTVSNRNSTSKTDLLYKEVFNRYLKNVSKVHGVTQVFVEGTRSRSGATLTPKSGLMTSFIEMYNDGEVNDLLFVPVSMSYECAFETASLVREAITSVKLPASLMRIFMSLLDSLFGGTLIGANCGSCFINIRPPVSLKNFVTFGVPPSPSALHYEHLPDKRIAKQLSLEVGYQLCDGSVVTITSIVAAVLLWLHGGIAAVRGDQDRGYPTGLCHNGGDGSRVRNWVSVVARKSGFDTDDVCYSDQGDEQVKTVALHAHWLAAHLVHNYGAKLMPMCVLTPHQLNTLPQQVYPPSTAYLASDYIETTLTNVEKTVNTLSSIASQAMRPLPRTSGAELGRGDSLASASTSITLFYFANHVQHYVSNDAIAVMAFFSFCGRGRICQSAANNSLAEAMIDALRTTAVPYPSLAARVALITHICQPFLFYRGRLSISDVGLMGTESAREALFSWREADRAERAQWWFGGESNAFQADMLTVVNGLVEKQVLLRETCSNSIRYTLGLGSPGIVRSTVMLMSCLWPIVEATKVALVTVMLQVSTGQPLHSSLSKSISHIMSIISNRQTGKEQREEMDTDVLSHQQQETGVLIQDLCPLCSSVATAMCELGYVTCTECQAQFNMVIAVSSLTRMGVIREEDVCSLRQTKSRPPHNFSVSWVWSDMVALLNALIEMGPPLMVQGS